MNFKVLFGLSLGLDFNVKQTFDSTLSLNLLGEKTWQTLKYGTENVHWKLGAAGYPEEIAPDRRQKGLACFQAVTRDAGYSSEGVSPMLAVVLPTFSSP